MKDEVEADDISANLRSSTAIRTKAPYVHRDDTQQPLHAAPRQQARVVIGWPGV